MVEIRLEIKFLDGTSESGWLDKVFYTGITECERDMGDHCAGCEYIEVCTKAVNAVPSIIEGTRRVNRELNKADTIVINNGYRTLICLLSSIKSIEVVEIKEISQSKKTK